MVPAPTLVVKNQFGEEQNLFQVGGTNNFSVNFIVDPANGNGLGIRSLKGSPLVLAVYMHTSATPAVGNPNPAVGLALIEFSEAFQGYITGVPGFVSPLSGTPINITSGLTIGQAYVVVSVGTSTLANWQALGFKGTSVNVGAAFIATSSSAGVGTGVVETSSVSGIESVEVIGDPNQTCNPTIGGGSMVVQFLAPTSSSVTTVIPTAPATNSVVGLSFTMNNPTNGPII
jgi:hypothetical protein